MSPLVCLPGSEGELWVLPSEVVEVDQIAQPGLLFTFRPDGTRVRRQSAGFTTIHMRSGREHTVEATAAQVVTTLWPEGGPDAV